jgi:hypothetical protein
MKMKKSELSDQQRADAQAVNMPRRILPTYRKLRQRTGAMTQGT